nr:MFS transporter [Streptomyces spinosus]
MSDGRLVLPVVLSATFVQLLNVTVAQVAAPAIQAGPGAGPGAVQLVLAGYTLTYACLLIPAARLGDRYGYRRLFVAGIVVFTAGSMAGACASDAASLIAARLVQGSGSGLVAPRSSPSSRPRPPRRADRAPSARTVPPWPSRHWPGP